MQRVKRAKTHTHTHSHTCSHLKFVLNWSSFSTFFGLQTISFSLPPLLSLLMYILCHHKMLFILYEMLLMLPYRKHKSGNRTQERAREGDSEERGRKGEILKFLCWLLLLLCQCKIVMCECYKLCSFGRGIGLDTLSHKTCSDDYNKVTLITLR